MSTHEHEGVSKERIESWIITIIPPFCYSVPLDA